MYKSGSSCISVSALEVIFNKIWLRNLMHLGETPPSTCAESGQSEFTVNWEQVVIGHELGFDFVKVAYLGY